MDDVVLMTQVSQLHHISRTLTIVVSDRMSKESPDSGVGTNIRIVTQTSLMTLCQKCSGPPILGIGHPHPQADVSTQVLKGHSFTSYLCRKPK